MYITELIAEICINIIVSGCIDSVPTQSTTDCLPTGGTHLTIHGFDFPTAQDHVRMVEVVVGSGQCQKAHVVDRWTVVCTLAAGTGEELHVEMRFHMTADYR